MSTKARRTADGRFAGSYRKGALVVTTRYKRVSRRRPRVVLGVTFLALVWVGASAPIVFTILGVQVTFMVVNRILDAFRWRSRAMKRRVRKLHKGLNDYMEEWF